MDETGFPMGTESLPPPKHLALQSLAPDIPDSGTWGSLTQYWGVTVHATYPLSLHTTKTESNTGPSRYLLKNTNKYCLAVPTTPVLTLLLDQTAGRTLPVLSEVMNPGIKCRSMDTNIPFASSGD